MILVVDDDRTVRELVTSILSRGGHQVRVAASADEALRLLEDQPPDLLLTDIVMPGMSGRELADRLSKLRPDLRVLHISGYTENAILEHGIFEEHVQFIQKPFTPQALTRKVREVLNLPAGTRS